MYYWNHTHLIGINKLILTYDCRLKVGEISEKLGSLYSEMIFKYGFVHSDPHPGNLLINKDKNGQLNLILLDHGLYAVSFKTVSFKIYFSTNSICFRLYLIALGIHMLNYGWAYWIITMIKWKNTAPN